MVALNDVSLNDLKLARDGLERELSYLNELVVGFCNEIKGNPETTNVSNCAESAFVSASVLREGVDLR